MGHFLQGHQVDVVHFPQGEELLGHHTAVLSAPEETHVHLIAVTAQGHQVGLEVLVHQYGKVLFLQAGNIQDLLAGDYPVLLEEALGHHIENFQDHLEREIHGLRGEVGQDHLEGDHIPSTIHVLQYADQLLLSVVVGLQDFVVHDLPVVDDSDHSLHEHDIPHLQYAVGLLVAVVHQYHHVGQGHHTADLYDSPMLLHTEMDLTGMVLHSTVIQQITNMELQMIAILHGTRNIQRKEDIHHGLKIFHCEYMILFYWHPCSTE